MFVVKDDMSIYVTRGDICFFAVSAETSEGNPFTFMEGDILRLKISTKKDCEDVVLVKDYTVESDCESMVISLTGKDTKIGPVISKPVVYWYEICLNPETNPQTLVGYDDKDGPKLFQLLPEGRDMNGEDITPGDIPWVDTELDDSSGNPIANQAVAREIERINESLKYKLSSTGGSMIGPINMSENRIVNLGNPMAKGDAVNLKYLNDYVHQENEAVLKTVGEKYATSEAVEKLSAEATGAIPAPDTTSAVGNCLVVTAVDENGRPVEWGTANVSGSGSGGVDGKNGKDGVTFTPSVNADGNLSWTNDGGLDNPAVVNIKGYDGKDGEDGKDGYTPIKGTDYFTEKDKAELVSAVIASMTDGDEVSY